MQQSRRRPPPPWERGNAAPRHSVGRTRRRFPEAEVAGPAQRYRRCYDGAGDRRVNEGVRVHRRQHGGVMQTFRRTPLRDGLIGLSVMGAAAPLAMSRLSALRTDSSHEQIIPSVASMIPLSDRAVGNAWRAEATRIASSATDAEATKSTARSSYIQQKMDRYSNFGLDRKLAESIYDLALQEDIEPEVAFGLVRTESEFKATAQSHVGAIGLTQLMPSTARWMRPGTEAQDLKNPEVNLQIGFRYLRELITKYDGDSRLALLAYNRGPGTVDRVLKRGGDPDNGYAKAVFTGEGVHR
ncbi:MAG TPA: lytic transglycosylase domain-containing protein [Longimicrobium sp.]|nr:lytic transglycosylase domain-containing protein [Longimicrobium sp.]